MAVVVGRNCRAIRVSLGVTQERFAAYAREAGLRWTSSKVGDFERGRREVSFGSVVAVSWALSRAWADAREHRTDGGAQPALADLLRFDGNVVLTPDGPDPLGDVVADVCSGRPWPTDAADLLGAEEARVQQAHERVVAGALSRAVVDGCLEPDVSATELTFTRQRSGLTEDRLAKRLGISRDRLAAVSFRLWKGTFSEKRDQLAGADANAQKRGRITRELRAEIEKELAGGDDK